MAQEYVGGGSKKLPTYKKTAPVAPRKPLPSSNPRPAAPPKKATPAPVKKTVVKPKPVPKAVPASGKKPVPAKPAPATKVPNGKLADVYRDVHKNVPKVTPKAPAKPAPAKPAPSKPGSSSGSGGSTGGGYKTVPAPTNGAPAKPAAPKPTAPAAPKLAAPKPIDPKVLESQKRLDDLWNQAAGYKEQLDRMMKGDFDYDPTKDASYQALQELAMKNAKSASVSAMEDMNDRGILSSTVTSDRMGQIQQSAQDEVTRAVPQLQQAAYQKQMDKAQQLYNMWNNVYNQATQERAFGEDTRRWEAGFNFDKEKYAKGNEQWQKEFDLKKWQVETGQDNWEREQAFRETQTQIENGLKSRGLELDHLQYQLNELATMQKQNGYYDEKATQQGLASALKYGDAAGAAEWLRENSTALYQNGADLTAIIGALDKRFGGFQDAVTGGGGGSLFP